MGENLTEAETAELEQLRDEVIAKSGPNKGQPKAGATAENVVRLQELEVKAAQAELAETEAAETETEAAETETEAAETETEAAETETDDETEETEPETETEDGSPSVSFVPCSDDDVADEPDLLERMAAIESRINRIEAALKKNGIIRHSRYLASKGQIADG